MTAQCATWLRGAVSASSATERSRRDVGTEWRIAAQKGRSTTQQRDIMSALCCGPRPAILRRHDVPLCVLYLLCCFTCLLPGCLLQSGRWALDTHARTYYMSPAFHGGFASPAARAAAFSLCPKGAKKRCKNLHSILRACSVRVAQPKRLAGLRCCRAA